MIRREAPERQSALLIYEAQALVESEQSKRERNADTGSIALLRSDRQILCHRSCFVFNTYRFNKVVPFYFGC